MSVLPGIRRRKVSLELHEFSQLMEICTRCGATALDLAEGRDGICSRFAREEMVRQEAIAELRAAGLTVEDQRRAPRPVSLAQAYGGTV